MGQNQNPFAGIVRVRVCGLLEEDHKLLLLKHDGIGPSGFLWAPPGGGVEFGQSVEDTLIREFKEETGLDVSVDQFLYVNEYRDVQFHAIELFFRVSRTGGVLKLGIDPELPNENQMLSEAKFFALDEIQKMDSASIHNSLLDCNASEKVFQKNGFFTFSNI